MGSEAKTKGAISVFLHLPDELALGGMGMRVRVEAELPVRLGAGGHNALLRRPDCARDLAASALHPLLLSFLSHPCALANFNEILGVRRTDGASSVQRDNILYYSARRSACSVATPLRSGVAHARLQEYE
eukprot:6206127-Pleurochrysis_carterae.AAC.1